MAVDAGPMLAGEDANQRSVMIDTPIQLLEIRHVSGETWDEAAAGFDGIAQEQLYAFARIRWPGAECEPILFRDGQKVVGGVLMMIQPVIGTFGAIAVAKWGPVLADTRSDRAAHIYAAMVETLIAEYADRRGLMLSILPRARPTHENMAYARLSRRGFSDGSQLLFPDRYIVNLRQDDEALRKSFAQKWRYHLNKSMKQDLSFERADAEAVDVFDRLYEAMAERKRFADHSAYETVAALMAMPNDALRPELFFVRKDEELVGGAIIFKAGDTAVYLYGATNDKALPLRAGYFMHYHIIRWLRDNTKADWYDLGGTDGFQGLHQFKKGMVGTAGFIEPVPPVMNYASHLKAKVIGTSAYWARDTLQRLRRRIEILRGDLATPDQERE